MNLSLSLYVCIYIYIYTHERRAPLPRRLWSATSGRRPRPQNRAVAWYGGKRKDANIILYCYAVVYYDRLLYSII